MAITAARLQVEVGADTRDAERGLDRVSDRVHGTGQRLQGIGTAMVGAGRMLTRTVTGPVVAAGTAIGVTGAGFESEMSKIVGLVGVAQDEVDEWAQHLLQLGPELGKSPRELAEALFFVASAGFEGTEALDVLEVAARASAAGLGDTMTIADAVTSAVNAFGIENLSASEAADILTAAVREGKLEAETLAPVLGRLMPLAAELGIQFDETAGFLAAMSRTGLDANEGVTALRGVMQTLVNPSQQARDVLEEFGLSAQGLREQVREEGLLATLETLRDTFGDNEEAMAQVFPNARALTGILNVLGQDGDVVAGVMEGVANSTSSVDDALAAVEQTTQHQFRQAMAQVQALLIELSATVLPLVVDALSHLSGWVETAAEWWRGLNPNVQRGIVVFLGLAAAIGPVLVIGGLLVKAIGVIITVLGAVLTPVGLVVVAIAALVAALVWAWNNSETFRNVVTAVFEFVARHIGRQLRIARQIIETVVSAIQIVWSRWGDNITNIVQAVWNQVRLVIDTVINVVRGIIMTVSGLITGDWEKFGEGIGTIAGAFMNLVQGTIDNGLQFIRNLWPMARDFVLTVWSAMWDAIQERAVSMLEGIRNAIRDRIDTVIGFFRELPGRIRSAIANPGDLLRSVGRAIIDGLIGGITSRVSAAVSAVRDAVSGIRQGAQAALGISSPSKVFAEIGDDVMAGLMLGLERHEAELAEMLTRMVPTIPSPQSVNGAIGGPTDAHAGGTTVHVNVQGSVVTEQDLVESIRRSLIRTGRRNVTSGVS